VHKLDALRDHFHAVTLLETDSFSKTLRRHRAWVTPRKRLKWAKYPTPKGAPLDELFAHNAKIVRSFYEQPYNPAPALRHHSLRQIIRRAANRDDKTIQPGLLDNLHPPGETRSITADRHRMIPAAKP